MTLVCIVDTSGEREGKRERTLTVNGDDDSQVDWCHRVIFGLNWEMLTEKKNG